MLFGICLQTLLVIFIRSAHGNPGEHQIKTAMIYNMAKFTDWPPDALPADQNQFLICVLGKGRLGSAVETLQGKQVRGRTITIRSISSPAEAASCQILVVAESERKQISGILDKARHYRLMTISDSEGFAKAGGLVGFFMEDGRVRFEINTTAVQRHTLRINAQVLKLSRIVQD